MDVSCPRCKTEYEFEDERVPEAGVTVKCTTCQHVFRVRRKTMAVTLPVKQSEITTEPGGPPPPPPPTPVATSSMSPTASASIPPPAASPLPGMSSGPQREWKVRQLSGNIFTFRELTTLQKWIVERKVSRDDEISLTGESWKRLGDIAELASFFQVVDAALKAQQLEAMQKAQALPPVIVSPPPPPPETPRPSAPPRPRPTDTLRDPSFGKAAGPFADDEKTQIDRSKHPVSRPATGGGAAKWVGLVIAMLGLGGAAGYYYLNVWQPAHQPAPAQPAGTEPAAQEPTPAVAPDAAAEAQAAAASAQAKAAAEAQAAAEAKAAADAKAKAEADEKAKAAAAAVPAPEVDAGSTKVADQPAKAADAGVLKRDADGWISLADRYRDRDRPEDAMAAYSKALEQQPKNIEALTGKGLCYLDMAKPHLAEPILKQAVSLNGRYAPALMGLAEAYRLQQKKDEALVLYQRYLEQFPNGAEAGVAKAQIDRLTK